MRPKSHQCKSPIWSASSSYTGELESKRGLIYKPQTVAFKPIKEIDACRNSLFANGVPVTKRPLMQRHLYGYRSRTISRGCCRNVNRPNSAHARHGVPSCSTHTALISQVTLKISVRLQIRRRKKKKKKACRHQQRPAETGTSEAAWSQLNWDALASQEKAYAQTEWTAHLSLALLT